MDQAAIQQPDNLVPVPSGAYPNIDHWLEESIWGHRLWHRQTPWLVFLEMLNIADGRAAIGAPFGSSPHVEKDYVRSRKRLLLRYLLYRNADVTLLASKPCPDAELWEAWSKYFAEQLDDDAKIDVAFLRSRFARFRDFAATIKLLRETTVYPSNSAGEATSERRWTSTFVFPFGTAALYVDLDESFSRDASRFGRTGDILYQMLARSKHAAELTPLFQGFLNTDRQLNKLVAKLQDPASEEWNGSDRESSYLPYRSHAAYDRLAEDWLHIHRLKLAGYDAYQHYVTLAAFHLILYHLETAAAWAHWPRVRFFCEVLAPKMEAARRLSIESFQTNEGATLQALAAGWLRLISGPEFRQMEAESKDLPEEDRVAEMRDFIHEQIVLPSKDYLGCSTTDELKARIWENIESKAEDNLCLLHRAYGRACGLVSRRGARLYRYAPTDSFLKTIVLATVEKRMELREFLQIVFERYHLVFGPNEANAARGSADFDASVFEKNARRLEERLKSMGMLNRLSDGVAFVENPSSTA
jgi:hypothetical protein